MADCLCSLCCWSTYRVADSQNSRLWFGIAHLSVLIHEIQLLPIWWWSYWKLMLVVKPFCLHTCDCVCLCLNTAKLVTLCLNVWHTDDAIRRLTCCLADFFPFPVKYGSRHDGLAYCSYAAKWQNSCSIEHKNCVKIGACSEIIGTSMGVQCRPPLTRLGCARYLGLSKVDLKKQPYNDITFVPRVLITHCLLDLNKFIWWFSHNVLTKIITIFVFSVRNWL